MREGLKAYILYLAARAGISLIRILPTRILESTINITLNGLRYRQKVVENNLSKSFKNKDQTAIKALSKKYYKHLAEVTVAQLKSKPKKPLKYIDVAYINSLFEKYNVVLLLGSHYGDWEAAGKGITPLLDNNTAQYVAYKRLKNRYLDNYTRKLRSDTVATPIDNKSIPKLIINNHKSNIKSAFYLIADQYPSSLQNIEKIVFLGRETYFINGPLKLAEKYKLPVVYLAWEEGEKEVKIKVEKIYEPNEHSSLNKPKNVNILEQYASLLQAQIMKNPAHWLWSHKRWKNLDKKR